MSFVTFTLTAVIFPTIIGYILIRRLLPSITLPTGVWIALGYGMGTGILTQLMLLLAIGKVPLTLAPIAIGMLSIGLLALIKRNSSSERIQLNPRLPDPDQKIDLISVFCKSYIILCVLYVIFRAIHIPLYTWDAYSCNGFKAKALYFEQSLSLLHNMPHYEYPLHVPFLQVWASISANMWHDQWIKIFFPLYTLALITVLHFTLRLHVSKQWALFGLAVILSSNLYVYHSTISYRDITLAYYVNTSIAMLLLWMKSRQNSLLLTAGIFTGFATFVKLDAAGYLLVLMSMMFFLVVFDRSMKLPAKVRHFFLFTLPAVLICLVYNIYKILVIEPRIPAVEGEKMSFDLFSVKIKLGLDTLVKLQTVLGRIFENLFFSGNWSVIWLLFAISLIHLRSIKVTAEIRILLYAIVAFMGIQILGYTLTQYYFWIAQTNTSLSRHLLHYFPIVVSLMVLINGGELVDQSDD